MAFLISGAPPATTGPMVRQALMQRPPSVPFFFGPGGQPMTATQLRANRAVEAALMARMSTPHSLGEGLSGLGDAIVYRVTADRDNAAEQAGTDAYTKQFDALGDNPDRAALTAAAPNGFETPGQSAIWQSEMAQAEKQADPSYQLDQEYRQAQIDALKNKPAQPLINAGSGSIYDPNSGKWITNHGNAGGTPAPAVSFTSAGVPDPDQQAAFIKSLSPDDATNVQGMIDYRIDPTKLASIRGGGESERQRLITLAQQADPSFDLSQFGARAAAKKAYTTGLQGQTITSANTVIGHLSNLADDADKLGNSDFVPLNMASNAIKGAFSNPDLAKFQSDQKAVASELAKFFKGTGSTDMTTTEEWLSAFDQNKGAGATRAVVQNIVGNLMKSRLDEMRSQYTAAMGKPSDFKFITPETDKVLTRLGIKSSELDPTFSGSTTDTPPGNSPTAGEPATVSNDADYDALPSGTKFKGPDGKVRQKP